ncbi:MULTISPECIES: toll/interleukin-1 receptor domain-containing protein [Bacillus]|uniref:toll/interleukin-1 receptor domain-containing protein n=1 Tax=Bacillus TaxID=1386 RepID=UPI000B4BBE00|nr:toll/interleukin-1 receptor domain-containing protein [Bacillus sp. S0635]MCP1285245.1 toll/interleukin-1 receptor domain-containing protein [Bacillus sp. S0635]
MAEQIESIFISHAHRDEEYVRQLANLLTMMGVPNIICSSHPDYRIPNDVDIYNYLSKHLNGNTWVVFVLSKHYYDSEACLNEMGACWVLNKKYTAVLLPNFDFGEMKGAINPRQVSFKLNNNVRLREFLESAAKEFSLPEKPESFLNNICQDAIEKVNILSGDEERDEKRIQGSVEAVRINSKDRSKIDVLLRLSNPLEETTLINVIKINLTDEKDEVLEVIKQPTLKLYPNENRFDIYTFDIGESMYDPIYRDEKKESVSLRCEKHVW